MSTTQEAMSTWLHQPDKSLSLSLSINGGGGEFWRQFTIIKEEQKRQSLKDALPHHPKQKHLRRLSVAMVVG